MEISLSQSQQHILSQQMRQSVEILQMNTWELGEYLKQMAVENPVVELDESWREPPMGLEPLREEKLRWLYTLDQTSHVRRVSPGKLDDPPDVANHADVPEENLWDTLTKQASGFLLSDEQMRALHYLIGNLDENGYLTMENETLSNDLGLPLADVEVALDTLHQMEPSGLGAHNLSECLLLQLARKGLADGLASKIVRSHLDLLAQNQLTQLAKATGASLGQVKFALGTIKSLNPKPGNGFSAKALAQYITPDLFIVRFADHYEILLNDYGQPQLKISASYRELAQQPDVEPEAVAYLDEKLRQAQWVMRCISQRQNTLLSCAQIILKRQEAFFSQGTGHHMPMSLSNVAEALGMHPSTVSRAVRGKYLQCQWGVFPLSDFFTRAVGDAKDQNTRESICGKLRLLISREDHSHPLSDQAITEQLNQQGIAISRRTVAKYRDALGILPASGRKVYE